MIISDSLKYVFVEIPHTASSSVHNELVSHYQGRPILFKHSSYRDFLRHAKPEQRAYRVIATVRNPLDIVVSKYHKARTDHHGLANLTSGEIKAKGEFFSKRDRKAYQLVGSEGIDFETYFRAFYRRVFNSRTCQLPKEKLLLMRYETLNDDFARILGELGQSVNGPLPLTNVTQKCEKSWENYYTPAIRQRAIRIFGPYMKRWDYEFPDSWGKVNIPALNHTLLKLDDVFRTLHYDFFHFPVRRFLGQGKKMP